MSRHHLELFPQIAQRDVKPGLVPEGASEEGGGEARRCHGRLGDNNGDRPAAMVITADWACLTAFRPSGVTS
ncbi:MAG: hypothetical protein AMXMBFR57_02670 [Acidimicrobiia bacterium]